MATTDYSKLSKAGVLKRVRTVVRTKADEAEVWRAFDDMLADAQDLQRAIADKRVAVEALEKQAADAREAIATAKGEAAKIVETARADARAQVEQANKAKDAAAADLSTAETTLRDARDRPPRS